MANAWAGHEAILLCPASRQPLSLLSDNEVGEANSAIVGGFCDTPMPMRALSREALWAHQTAR